MYFIMDVLGLFISIMILIVLLLIGDWKVLFALPIIAFIMWLHVRGIKKFKERI